MLLFSKNILFASICIIILYSIRSVRNTRTFVFVEWSWMRMDGNTYRYIFIVCLHSVLQLQRRSFKTDVAQEKICFCLFLFSKIRMPWRDGKVCSRDMNMTDLWHLFSVFFFLNKKKRRTSYILLILIEKLLPIVYLSWMENNIIAT